MIVKVSRTFPEIYLVHYVDFFLCIISSGFWSTFLQHVFQISLIQRQLQGTPSQSGRYIIRYPWDIEAYIIGCPSWIRHAPSPDCVTLKIKLMSLSKTLNTGVFDKTVFTSVNTFQWTYSSHLKCVSNFIRPRSWALILNNCGANIWTNFIIPRSLWTSSLASCVGISRISFTFCGSIHKPS